MTCVLPTAQTVYTGDEDGRVVSTGGSVVEVLMANDGFQYEWDCIRRHDGR